MRGFRLETLARTQDLTMTFKKNKVFEFVTAVLYKTSFGRVGTYISYLLTHAVIYVIFLPLEHSNDFLNGVLDIKPQEIRKDRRINPSWTEKPYFLYTSETLAAAYLIALPDGSKSTFTTHRF